MADSPQPFTAINPSDPPELKAAKLTAQTAKVHWGAVQNIALGFAVTLAFCTRATFPIEAYLGAIAVLSGASMLPGMRGKPPIGLLALLNPKTIAAAIAAGKHIG